jgi:hypothetical protein
MRTKLCGGTESQPSTYAALSCLHDTIEAVRHRSGAVFVGRLVDQVPQLRSLHDVDDLHLHGRVSRKSARARNDAIDVLLAAYGTNFGGVMSEDSPTNEAFHVARICSERGRDDRRPLTRAFWIATSSALMPWRPRACAGPLRRFLGCGPRTLWPGGGRRLR